MDNYTIAGWLTDYAHVLAARKASLYRIRAYRRAAQAVLGLDRPAAQIIATDGRPGLEAVPGIGPHLAYTIQQLVNTGEFQTWDKKRAGGADHAAGARVAG